MSSIPIAERQLGAAAGQPGATTSPSWGGISRTLMVHGLFLAAVLALLPVAASKGLEITAITPAFASLVFVTELTTSFLLFVQFRATRTWSVLLLGCAYLFGGLMPLLHLLTFPGAILQNQIILGTPQSTAWAFLFWMSGYSILMLAAVIAELAAPDRKLAPANTNRAAACAVAAILATAAACALVSTAMTDRLPPPMAGAAWTGLNTAIIYTAMSMLAASVLLILLFIGRRNTLFLWLSCALTAVLAATILSHAGGGRYTVGWSVGRLSWALSAVVLLIFFLRQFARQQHALAQARQFLEQRVAERTTDLTRTVHERDLLLREVHHRVKNNLQVVDSLMNLETSRLDDAAAKEAFERLRRRVFTLGLAHQQLASSEDIRAFSIAPFLRDLLENLSVALSAREASITFGVTAEPLPVNLDLAIPVGLIITELVSEAARAPRVRNVSVEFRQAGAGTALLAVDNDAAAPNLPRWPRLRRRHPHRHRPDPPARRQDEHPGRPGRPRGNPDAFNGDDMTLAAESVLIVEDEYLIAELLSSMVERMGLTVCGMAATADEAAELARLHQPRIVLMDVRLQGRKDGVDAALAIHAQVGSLVIFVTGSQEPATVARIHLDHPAAILFKPVSYGQLRKTIQDVSA